MACGRGRRVFPVICATMLVLSWIQIEHVGSGIGVSRAQKPDSTSHSSLAYTNRTTPRCPSSSPGMDYNDGGYYRKEGGDRVQRGLFTEWIPKIPKVVHQTWKTSDLPHCLAELRKTWIQLNPEWEVRLWNDTEIDRFCTSILNPEAAKMYLQLSGIQRADVWRVLCLQKFGGVYADLDMECLRPMEEFLEDYLVPKHLHKKVRKWRIHRRGMVDDPQNFEQDSGADADDDRVSLSDDCSQEQAVPHCREGESSQEIVNPLKEVLLVGSEPKAHCKSLFYHRKEVLCNAFIVASRSHNVMNKVAQKIEQILTNATEERLKKYDRGEFGPALMDYIIEREDYRDTKKIDPRHAYPIVDVTNIRIPKKYRDESYRMLSTGQFDDAYVVHYWYHTDWNLEGNENISCRDFLIQSYLRGLVFQE